MPETLLALHDVHVNFPAKKNWLGRVTERVHALNGMDLQIRRGETLGIVGESGCGKSTLAQLLMGMLKPSQGSINRIHRRPKCRWYFRTRSPHWIHVCQCGELSPNRCGFKHAAVNGSDGCWRQP